MKKLMTIMFITILILSCSSKSSKNKIENITSEIELNQVRDHEILNVILKRWGTLSHKLMPINNEDTIVLKQIVLTPKSYIHFKIDTIQDGFQLRPHRFTISRLPEHQEIRDAILRQIESSVSTKWDSTLISSIIKIDPSLTENKVSIPSQIHDKNSFLVVSKPIEFDENVVFVLGLLYTKNFLLDNLYIMEKIDGKWIVVDIESAIIKLVVSNPSEIIHNEDGSMTEELIVYGVFNGYLE